MIGIVDYGLGNVAAFLNNYAKLNIPARPLKEAKDFQHVTHLILPGVGSFDWAMERLNRSGVRDALEKAVLSQGIPVLGVCVGMQMLARRSDEGSLPGLGWLAADVVRVESLGANEIRLPHMGWNDIRVCRPDALLGTKDVGPFYFLHSFVVVPDRQEDILATAWYGGEFAVAVRRGEIVGTQFHPEKSHENGLRILENFGRYNKCCVHE